MMRIGIDCRIWGIKHAGLGRYTEQLVRNLQIIDRENEYVLFCRAKDIDEIPTTQNFRKVLADIAHYTFAEQLKLPQIFTQEKLDLLHAPHFNVPILYKGKFVVTIHDVLWHDVKGLNVTTLSAPKYAFKYIAYRGVVRSTVHRSRKIIAPTETVKNDLVEKFNVSSNKVIVTYEGATARIMKKYKTSSILDKYGVKQPYLLYVGNLYPHKNLIQVVRALKTMDSPPMLVIASGRNIFWHRFQKLLKDINAQDLVKMVGYVPDDELGALYNSAQAYTFPSLSEGFGLPGLEAMAYGTPVLASDISVFKEVYKDAVLYFDPQDIKDIADKIKELAGDEELRSRLISKGKRRVKQFSWNKMAKETLNVYKSVINETS